MKSVWIALVLESALVLSCSARDTGVETVVPGANGQVHLDMDVMRATDLGKALLEEMNLPGDRQQLDALQALLQFDPRTGLSGVTLYGYEGEQRGVILLSGAFPVSHLLTLAAGNASYQAETNATAVVHSWVSRGGNGTRLYAAFEGGKLLLLSTESGLILDTLKKMRAGKKDAPVQVAGVTHPFLTGRFEKSRRGVERDSPRPPPEEILSAQIALGEAEGRVQGEAILRARTPDAAARLSSMIEGFKALALLSDPENPTTQAWTSGIKIQPDGDTLICTLSVTATEAIEALRDAAHKARTSKHPAPDSWADTVLPETAPAAHR